MPLNAFCCLIFGTTGFTLSPQVERMNQDVNIMSYVLHSLLFWILGCVVRRLVSNFVFIRLCRPSLFLKSVVPSLFPDCIMCYLPVLFIKCDAYGSFFCLPKCYNMKLVCPFICCLLTLSSLFKSMYYSFGIDLLRSSFFRKNNK